MVESAGVEVLSAEHDRAQCERHPALGRHGEWVGVVVIARVQVVVQCVYVIHSNVVRVARAASLGYGGRDGAADEDDKNEETTLGAHLGPTRGNWELRERLHRQDLD